MGLMDLEDIDKEPNRGGRPSKSEQEDETRRHENGYIESEADEEWWSKTLDEVLDDDELADQGTKEFKLQVEELVTATCVSPIEVRKFLEQHGFIEHDWVDFLAHRPHLAGDGRLPEEWRDKTGGHEFSMSDTIAIERGAEEPMHDFFDKLSSGLSPDSGSSDMLSNLMGSSSSSSSDSDNEASDGLQSLIEDDEDDDSDGSDGSGGIDSLLEETKEEEDEDKSSSLDDLL